MCNFVAVNNKYNIMDYKKKLYKISAETSRERAVALVRIIRRQAYALAERENSRYPSDADFARVIGLTPAQFSRVASGVCTPSLETWLSLRTLRVTLSDEIAKYDCK